MSGGVVITDTATQVKWPSLIGMQCPAVAINDPLLMVGMPPALTAATGMDALTHAVEGYVAILCHSADRVHRPQGRRVSRRIPACSSGKRPESVSSRQNGLCRVPCRLNDGNAGLGLVHAMAHQLGGFYNLPHGVCNAILLPVVCEFNMIACTQRFADIAVALGENITGLSTAEAGAKAVAAIRRLSKEVGIPANLSELGVVKESDFETLAANALKDACAIFNPRPASLKEVVSLFQAAMGAPLAKAAAK